MVLPILTELRDKSHLLDLLKQNTGALIIKFGAEWCGPCKQIESHVVQIMNRLPDTIQSMIIDIDEYLEVYAFLKTKKIVNGIPVLMAYYKGNLNYIPDDIVIGANINQIELFFERVYNSTK
jgi:thiol-disulfide isomerase/thioredoxin